MALIATVIKREAWSAMPIFLLPLSFLGGCRNNPQSDVYSGKQDLAIHACLENLELKVLENSLSHCNRVVTAYPNSPVPLNDRAFIYILMGHRNAACQDVKMAQNLIQQFNTGGDALSTILRHELLVRHVVCSAGKPDEQAL
ncbi:hypothetical protein OMCYN_00720 [cyanobiont of Ornithocercus magnificus]|nr:hypothetical protein OMCYN_00720 [cyanobiont of Ornithocercus magnificus]